MEVHVRTPFERLPEFDPDSTWRCRDGWENTDVPWPKGTGR